MTGKRVGYIRVSTIDQNIDRQLVDIPLDKKFIDYASAKTKNRPQLQAMLDFVREDDIVIVHSFDRLARNSRDLLEIVDNLVNRKIQIQFIKNNLTFTGKDSPMAKFQLQVMAAVAEMEREILVERIREGVAEAKKQGKYKGRHTKLTSEVKQKIEERMKTRDSKLKIARDLKISNTSFYRYLKLLNIER